MPDPDPKEILTRAIRAFSEAPQNALDFEVTTLCAAFDPEKQDPATFLRNLRDLVARYSLGSDFVVMAISAILDTTVPEEDLFATKARRDAILRLEEQGKATLADKLNATGE